MRRDSAAEALALPPGRRSSARHSTVEAKSRAENPSRVSGAVSAPLASRRSTTSALPDEAAYISGVAPLSLRLADAGKPQRIVAVGISGVQWGARCYQPPHAVTLAL